MSTSSNAGDGKHAYASHGNLNSFRHRLVVGLAMGRFQAACRRALIVPVLALLSMSGAANADSPATKIEIVDIDLAQPDAIGVRNDCWADAPMGAKVECGGSWPEHNSPRARVTLSPATSTAIVIGYQSMDLTATGGTDYEALDGTLTFAAGEVARTFDLTFLDDLLEEGNEEFVVKFDAPAGISVGADYLHLTIIDEESIRISLGDASINESDGEVRVPVMYSDWVFWAVQLHIVTSDGTAVAPDDYEVRDEVVQLPDVRPARYMAFSSPHNINDDALDEPDERFTVTISGHQYVNMDGDTGTVTILDDDDPPSVSIADVSGLEDSVGKLAFVATLSDPSGKEVVVDWQTVNGTAIADTDYARDFGTLTFAPGDERRTIEVTVEPDDLYEGDETFTLALTNPQNVTVSDPEAVGTIEDDDAQLSIADTAASEADGELAFLVKADGLKKQNQTVTVNYATADETATEPGDYRSTTGTLTFTSTDTERTITVNVVDDTVDEPDEKLSVTLTNPMNATIGIARAEGTIRDNDVTSAEITLTAEPPRVSEGEGATPVAVTATLDAGARTAATTVAVTVSGSGNADAVDFAAVPDFTITIAAGDRSGAATFTLTPDDDDVDEADETLMVEGNSDLPVTGDTVDLADDDQTSAAIVLSASPARIAEDGSARSVRVTATLDGSARTVATTVTVSVADSGQPDAVDYVATPTAFEIAIAAGATSGTGTFTVAPEDDEIDERDEVLDISGTSDLPVTPTSVTLADDETTSTEILLSAVPSTVSEGAGATPVEVAATLNAGARTVATTVTVSVTGSGDPDAVDFAAVVDFTITIAAGATTGRGTFTLTPADDNVAENAEALAVDGSADLPVTGTSVTITDDDVGSNRIVLSASPALVSEGGGAVPVTVTASLNGAVRQAATTVTVSVAGSGNARAVDFQAVPDFEVTIAANAASGSSAFTLTPENDGTAEADETLDVTGTSDLPVTPTVVTLADDDDASTRILLSAVPERVSEGDGPTPVTVTATLDRALRQTPTPVTVSVSGSGDPDAVDFLAVADFALTIAANAASGTGTFTLTPEDDAAVEVDEQATVSGTSDLPVTPTAVTLVDDDEVSTRILLFLTVDPPRASEGDGAVRVTVTAAVDKGVRPEETRIRVSVAGSGDPDAVDFAAVPDFDIVIPANARDGTATFTVVPEDDLIVEADETLTVSGVSDLPVTPATMELLDDDEASTRILLSAVPARVSEGGGPVAVTVTASLDRGLRQQATTVTVSVAGGGDPDAVDFDPVADFVITIAAAAPGGTGTFTLTPEDDAEDEADETLALTGESDLPVSPASVVLADDDEMLVSRVLSVADASASESADDVAFAVTLDGPSPAEVTVRYATADPSGSADPVAEAGMDYRSVSGTLTLAPGEVSGTIRVPVVDDDVDEPDETFALVLSDLRGATLDRGSALGTIRDDDEPPALSIAGDTGPEDVGELVFRVTLTARALTGVTVNYATMDDTATAGDDYGPVEGTLTFAPGETAKTIGVAVIDDALDEAAEETFAVTLSGHTGATLAHSPATGVIRDDDEPPALSVADAAGDESVGALDFAVTLSAASGLGVSFSYATADGTATAGSDYAPASGTLAFAPGEVTQTIRVAILDDAVDEADEETFALTLSALANATAADGSATGTIRDDDLSPPTVAGPLPAAMLCVGGAAYELDLAGYFDGEGLLFSAVSSAPRVATATLAGSRLTVSPGSEGEASVTVTATNPAGSVGNSVTVRVVTDPAELEAVESVLASIGRGILTGVSGSVRDRFVERSASGEPTTSTIARRDPAPAGLDAGTVAWNGWPGLPIRGARSGGRDGSGLPESEVGDSRWPGATNRRGMVPFSFSLDTSQSGSTGPAWAVWARGDTQRFESGMDGTSHDGHLTALHLGADARAGDWLAGVSLASASAEADYRFERSVDACGGGGIGEGMVDAELTSVHPYAGRRVGRGWLWAALGAGGGEVSVERCATGRRNEADLSMRLAALGGRHPFAGGERISVSVVEEIGVLDLTTGDAPGPVGDRSMRVGQARLGLEVAGVAPADCECSLTTFVRAFARSDWGDGATGAGLELALGVRYRDLPRRLGIDAGIRALAVHSAEDAAEHSANLTFSILPRADGTGLQASLAWRQQGRDPRLDALGGISPWTGPAMDLLAAERHWIARSRFGYGIALRRGSAGARGIAMPFVELDAAPSDRGGARFGVRHEFGDRVRGLVVEWGIEQRGSFAGARNRIVLEVLGRF